MKSHGFSHGFLAAQEAMVVALAVGPCPRSQGVGGKPTPTSSAKDGDFFAWIKNGN